MALVRCPDCSTEISDQAPACVKCGRPQATQPPVRTALPRRKRDPYNRTALALVAMIGAMVLVGIVTGTGSRPPRTNPTGAQPMAPVADIEGACETMRGMARSNANAMANGVSLDLALVAAEATCKPHPPKVCAIMRRIVRAVHENRFTANQADQHVAANCATYAATE